MIRVTTKTSNNFETTCFGFSKISISLKPNSQVEVYLQNFFLFTSDLYIHCGHISKVDLLMQCKVSSNGANNPFVLLHSSCNSCQQSIWLWFSMRVVPTNALSLQE